jgi:aminopeptidase N
VLADVLRMITARSVDARHPVAGLVARYLPPDEVRRAEERIAELCLDLGGLVAVRGFLATAGPGDVSTVKGWLAGRVAPVPMDADLRWLALTRLAVLGEIGAAEIEAELRSDRTAAGEQHAARALAARPDPAAKAEAWRLITRDTERSNRLILATAEGFWQPYGSTAAEPYVERYFEDMPEMAGRRTQEITEPIATCAFPRFAAVQSTVELAGALLARADLDPALRRVVIDSTDELGRAMVGRAMVGRRAPR